MLVALGQATQRSRMQICATWAHAVWLMARGRQVESFAGNDMALQTLVGRETLHRMVGLLSSCERQVGARCSWLLGNNGLMGGD
jgi:hypothetical protein